MELAGDGRFEGEAAIRAGAEAPVAGLGAAAALVAGRPDDLMAACREAAERARADVRRFKSGAGLEAYDEAFAALNDATARAEVARNASTDPAVREAAERADQLVQKLLTELALDRELYEALQRVEPDDEATRHYLRRDLREFRRAGVDRDDATRAKVKELNEELVRLGQEFSRNIRDDVRRVRLDPAGLEGLPDDYRRAHAPGPDGKVTVTTDHPDVFPLLTYAKSGAAREAAWRAFNVRAYPQNLPVLARLLEKRHELATLLGHRSWAAYVTENKMIGTAAAAAAFIDRIARAAEARAASDLAALLERKRQDEPGAKVIQPWDSAYYADRIKAERYRFDSQAARPYFESSRVLQGVLDVTARLFGLEYRAVPGATVWHPSVQVRDVTEDGAMLGRIYLDLHPREGKYNHAAQFTLTSGRRGARLPEGALLCNFPPAPGLMEHSEVTTLFHEFGHLLHHVLGGQTRWAGLSGVRTEWDFVEAPSQLLEEWVKDAQVLRTFARHHESDEPIPIDTVERLRAADEFGKGVMVRRQMFLAATSLQMHDRDPRGLDSTALVRELHAGYSPFPHVPDTYFHCSFGHLESYTAAYYTYMWSLVIAKDLFQQFERPGLFDRGVADRYRRAVLDPGGGKPAAALVEEFLGRPYDFRAYQEWLAR